MSFEKYKLYDGSVELIFNPEKHMYMVGSETVVGATGVTGVINKPQLIPWAVNMAIEFMENAIEPGKSYDELQLKRILEGAKGAHRKRSTEATDIGTLVHGAIETYIKTAVKVNLIHPKAKACFDNFINWAETNHVEFFDSERKVYSVEHNYAGTMDFRCKLNGKLYIGDIKTSKAIYDEYWFQVSGYQQAYEEETEVFHDGQLIVRVGKDGSFEIQERTTADYLENVKAFNGALALYKRLQVLKDLEKGKE